MNREDVVQTLNKIVVTIVSPVPNCPHIGDIVKVMAELKANTSAHYAIVTGVVLLAVVGIVLLYKTIHLISSVKVVGRCSVHITKGGSANAIFHVLKTENLKLIAIDDLIISDLCHEDSTSWHAKVGVTLNVVYIGPLEDF